MRTIIFDFDGTIADSFGTLVGIFEEVTNRKNRLAASEIEALRGQSVKEIISNLRIKKWQIPSLLIKGKHSIGLKIAGIKPFEGMPAVLKKLHQQNYQTFILSTNSSENISKFLKTHNLDPYITKIYGDIGLRGKAPALKKLLKFEQVSRQDAIYVGDEVRDVEAAQKVGVSVVAVGWGFNLPKTLERSKPTALATSPHNLLTILKKLGA